ncbi:MAG: SLC13 family permease [Clostridiales Family XIII bacterium]|jgi:anion transporter|nr:SLC13 family permease [Clostridiales Family XIII bacterium]
MAQSTIAIIILACIVVCFIANRIPMAITAVLGAIAMACFGVISFSDAFASFGADTVMMVFGVITIGNALFETGCAQYVGSKMAKIKWVAANEKRFLILSIIITALISAFSSNTATVAMMMPVVASMSQASSGVITRKNTYMSIGFAAVCGGNLTLAGSTPQLIAQGILLQTEGCRGLDFFELTKGALPVILLLILYFTTFGYKFQQRIFRFEEPPLPDGEEARIEYSRPKMICAGLIFLACIVGFVTGVMTMGTVAVLGASLCCLTGCISFNNMIRRMDWTPIIVLGGSLGFAKGIEMSGAGAILADWLFDHLFCGAEPSPFLVGFVIVVTCSLLSNFVSNTAVAAIMTPIAIALARDMGVDPIPLAIMVILSSNLAFATPIGTPPVTMTLVAGYRFSDYIKVGGVFNLLAIIVVTTTLPLLYRY